jgi:hypothetical protein
MYISSCFDNSFAGDWLQQWSFKNSLVKQQYFAKYLQKQ